ncbi:poliovirus receptor-like [Cyprinodon tularosa]|uniref:poliovirus receptor-like n=1 Tax=Cyprinodon tularosa TaxID=77115 RepID=UPI0018E24597|nr:poliovirus receptor-like [Cyprinodon tularosa]
MSSNVILLVLAFVCSRDAKAITVKLGDAAILPCKSVLQSNQNVIQISWQRRTREKPVTDNFLIIIGGKAEYINGKDNRFTYIGTFADNNGTLQLSNVQLKDEGTYTCIFSIAPIGSLRTDITLTVLVPPETSIVDARPKLGDGEVPLATCIAAGSKPPAEVEWRTDALKVKLRTTTNSTLHANDTTTTASTLLGTPTKNINRSPVECVIFTETLNRTLPYEILINYPPLEVKIFEGPMKDKSFTCEADASPNATITWSRSGNPLPSSITVQEGRLIFSSGTSDLNGLYQCVANNSHGSSHSSLYLHFHSGSNEGWIAFILLLVIVLAIAVTMALYRRGLLKLPSFFLHRRDEVPTSSPGEAESL